VICLVAVLNALQNYHFIIFIRTQTSIEKSTSYMPLKIKSKIFFIGL
jgi:hypothetical protein